MLNAKLCKNINSRPEDFSLCRFSFATDDLVVQNRKHFERSKSTFSVKTYNAAINQFPHMGSHKSSQILQSLYLRSK